jgi:hypothetical protein
MKRRIVLELGSTTTAMECGDCPRKEDGYCGTFGGKLGSFGPGRFERFRECTAAERAASSGAVEG